MNTPITAPDSDAAGRAGHAAATASINRSPSTGAPATDNVGVVSTTSTGRPLRFHAVRGEPDRAADRAHVQRHGPRRRHLLLQGHRRGRRGQRRAADERGDWRVTGDNTPPSAPGSLAATGRSARSGSPGARRPTTSASSSTTSTVDDIRLHAVDGEPDRAADRRSRTPTTASPPGPTTTGSPPRTRPASSARRRPRQAPSSRRTRRRLACRSLRLPQARPSAEPSRSRRMRTDNGTVASVQFKVDNNNLGAAGHELAVLRLVGHTGARERHAHDHRGRNGRRREQRHVCAGLGDRRQLRRPRRLLRHRCGFRDDARRPVGQRKQRDDLRTEPGPPAEVRRRAVLQRHEHLGLDPERRLPPTLDAR